MRRTTQRMPALCGKVTEDVRGTARSCQLTRHAASEMHAWQSPDGGMTFRWSEDGRCGVDCRPVEMAKDGCQSA